MDLPPYTFLSCTHILLYGRYGKLSGIPEDVLLLFFQVPHHWRQNKI